MGYGRWQKTAFTGIVSGFLMCATGTFSPFWKGGQIDANTLSRFLSIPVSFLNINDFLIFDAGLWLHCNQDLGGRKCEFFQLKSDDSTERWAYRVSSIASLLLSLSCVLAGLSSAWWRPGGKTGKHAAAAFLGGIAGVVTVSTFVSQSSSDDSILKIETSYGWAYYVYIIGTGLILWFALLLSCALPYSPPPVAVAAVRRAPAPAPVTGGAFVISCATQETQSLEAAQCSSPSEVGAESSDTVQTAEYQGRSIQTWLLYAIRRTQ